MDLGGKVALVTGAARGVGFATAEELLRNGVKHVTIADLATSDGKKSAETLNAEFGKGRAIFVVCDVSKTSDFETAFAKTVKEFGGLDIVVNNAGVVNEKQWESMVNVNLNGEIRGIHLGLQYMGKHKGGKGGVIVNVASILGFDCSHHIPIYAATKHGIIGLGQSYGSPYYYEMTGVRVVTVCPGFTETPILATIPPLLSDLVDPDSVISAFTDTKSFPTQKPDKVGRAVAEVIKSAESGSIWITEGEEPVYEVSMPVHSALRVSPKN